MRPCADFTHCCYPPPIDQFLRANGINISDQTYREKYWGRSTESLDLIAPAFDGAGTATAWLKQHFKITILHNTLLPQRMVEWWLQSHGCFWDEILFVDDPEKLTIADKIDILIDDNPQTLWA